MLANAASWAAAEGHKRKRMQVVALFLPSLWPELVRVFEDGRVVMAAEETGTDRGSFVDGDVANVGVNCSFFWD